MPRDAAIDEATPPFVLRSSVASFANVGATPVVTAAGDGDSAAMWWAAGVAGMVGMSLRSTGASRGPCENAPPRISKWVAE